MALKIEGLQRHFLGRGLQRAKHYFDLLCV